MGTSNIGKTGLSNTARGSSRQPRYIYIRGILTNPFKGDSTDSFFGNIGSNMKDNNSVETPRLIFQPPSHF